MPVTARCIYIWDSNLSGKCKLMWGLSIIMNVLNIEHLCHTCQLFLFEWKYQHINKSFHIVWDIMHTVHPFSDARKGTLFLTAVR